jgi:hypothetical protein
MARTKKENPIALEIEEYENKIKEFQNYLKQNPIVSIVTIKGEIKEEPESQDKRHSNTDKNVRCHPRMAFVVEEIKRRARRYRYRNKRRC